MFDLTLPIKSSTLNLNENPKGEWSIQGHILFALKTFRQRHHYTTMCRVDRDGLLYPSLDLPVNQIIPYTNKLFWIELAQLQLKGKFGFEHNYFYPGNLEEFIRNEAERLEIYKVFSASSPSPQKTIPMFFNVEISYTCKINIFKPNSEKLTVLSPIYPYIDEENRVIHYLYFVSMIIRDINDVSIDPTLFFLLPIGELKESKVLSPILSKITPFFTFTITDY